MESDQKIEKTAILAAIEKLDIDAVLVTRLVSLKEEEIREPIDWKYFSEYGRPDDYHGRYYERLQHRLRLCPSASTIH